MRLNTKQDGSGLKALSERYPLFGKNPRYSRHYKDLKQLNVAFFWGEKEGGGFGAPPKKQLRNIVFESMSHMWRSNFLPVYACFLQILSRTAVAIIGCTKRGRRQTYASGNHQFTLKSTGKYTDLTLQEPSLKRVFHGLRQYSVKKENITYEPAVCGALTIYGTKAAKRAAPTTARPRPPPTAIRFLHGGPHCPNSCHRKLPKASSHLRKGG